MRRDKSEYSVQAVDNALDILEFLGDVDGELSVTEISARLNLTKSNVNKLLATLEYFGYVDVNKYTGNYKLGVKTFQISQAYFNKLNIIDSSVKIMTELRDKVGESVYISVLRGSNVVYLNVVETLKSVRVRPRIGNVGPAYATATGKAQLAFLEDFSPEKVFKDNFVKLTKNTIDNVESLKEHLDNVRQTGFALDLEEYEEGVVCVAAPVFNFMKKVIAGISISAPIMRMSEEKLVKDVAPLVKNAAKQLSFKFGYKDKK
ncbi:MAG: IclR family transcriptional regulator [Calditerrivibrio sp.]|nr:IclR family transcriptional regulator [Calditerrivibrio sp.]